MQKQHKAIVYDKRLDLYAFAMVLNQILAGDGAMFHLINTDMNHLYQRCQQLINRLRSLHQQANQQINELLAEMVRRQITGFISGEEEDDEEGEGEGKQGNQSKVTTTLPRVLPVSLWA